jgi:hypothetical protein
MIEIRSCSGWNMMLKMEEWQEISLDTKLREETGNMKRIEEASLHQP